MKKIMFNDKYGLTAAVLKGRKTMTRRIIKAPRHTIEGKEVCGFAVHKTHEGVPYEVWLTGPDDESLCQLLPTYKVDEIVAVAQSYESMANGGYFGQMTVPSDNAVGFEFKLEYCGGGYKNKMFVAADLMPHHIRITDIKVERLQDISDEDCLKEGIYIDESSPSCYYPFYTFKNSFVKRTPLGWDNARDAFAALIDKVSGKGTWDSNSYVFAYSFEKID